MAIVRRFLIAPAFARLVRKERGAVRVTEGYFPNQSGRQSHVLVEGSQCHLVLVTPGNGGAPTEERTEVPRGHADALRPRRHLDRRHAQAGCWLNVAERLYRGALFLESG